MSWFNSAVDDFHINLNINTELEVACTNEAVFHYFELIQRHFPGMNKFEAQDVPEWIRVFEENSESSSYRWLTVEKNRICSGFTNPETMEDAYQLHRKVLDLAPAALSVSPLNVKSIDLLFGFDMTCEGNQDEIVAKALAPACFDNFIADPANKIINYEPNITFAVDDIYNIQCRLYIETRTTVPQLVSGKIDDNQFTVYFAARKYWSARERDFLDTFERLVGIAEKYVDRNVVPHIIKPLSEIIASQ